MIQKNVASQKIHFLMVDATDFATPETGKTVTAKYYKDGGGLSTCSNSVSECTSGLYKITLAATETNAGVVSFQMTNASCADQWLVFYPDDGYAAGISDLISNLSNAISTLDGPVASQLSSIEADTGNILTDTQTTLDNKIDSILVDTGTTILNLVSDVLSTVDGPVISTLDRNQTDLDAILADTGTTLDNKIDSVLADTQSLIVDVSDVRSGITGVYSALSDFEATAAGDVTEIKSDITAVYSALSDAEATLSNAISALHESVISDVAGLGAGSDSAILSTLDGPVVTVMGNKVTSILADTITLSNATYGLNALETLVSTLHESVISDIAGLGAGSDSAILSTLDGPVITVIGDKVTSILADTKSLIVDVSVLSESLISDIAGLGAGSDSAILSTLDGPIVTVIGNKVTSILADTTPLVSDITAIYSALSDAEAILISDVTAVKSSVSDVLAMVTGNSDILSQILVDTATTLDNKVDSILADTQSLIVDVSNTRSGVLGAYSALSDFEATNATTLSNLRSGVTGVYSALSDAEATIVSDVTAVYSALSDFEVVIISDVTAVKSNISNVLSTIDGPVISDLSNIESTVAVLGGDSNKITSILADTQSLIVDISDVRSGVTGVYSALSDLEGAVATKSALTSNVWGHGSATSLLTITSDILSTLDDNVASELTAIKSDVTAVYSALSDAEATLSGAVSALHESAISDIGGLGAGSDSAILSTLDGPVIATIGNKVTSILADTTPLVSDITAVYSALSDAEATISGAISTLSGAISALHESAISDIGGLGAGSDSAILSTLDGPIITTIGNKVTSILADTTPLVSDITAIYSALSDAEATLISDVAAVKSSVSDVLAMSTSNSNILSQILVDTATTLDNKLDSVLADTQSLIVDASDIKSAVDDVESNLSNAISTLDGPIHSTLDAIHSTLDGPVTSDLSNIESSVGNLTPGDSSGITSILTYMKDGTNGLSALESLGSGILSTLDGAGIAPVTAEPTAGAPSKTTTTGAKLDYLYTVMRNKIETNSGVQKVYAVDGTTVLFSCALSDDATTFTKGEHA